MSITEPEIDLLFDPDVVQDPHDYYPTFEKRSGP